VALNSYAHRDFSADDIIAATVSHYATTDFWLDLSRDIVWKYLYFFFCSSLIQARRQQRRNPSLPTVSAWTL
jgi:hypothetical protein